MNDLREQIKQISNKISQEEGDVSFFEYGDELIIPLTDDGYGLAGANGNTRNALTPDSVKPIIVDTGEEDGDGFGGGKSEKSPNKESENQGGSGGKGEKGGGGDKKVLSVGQKVKIKGTNKIGTITSINPDGEYVVTEDAAPAAAFDEGGVVTGIYKGDELSPIEDGDGNGDDGEGDGDEGDEGEGGEGEGESGEGQGDGDDSQDGDNEEEIPTPQMNEPLPEIDVRPFRNRVGVIKRHKFKLPAFAMVFFGAGLEMTDDNKRYNFYKERFPLVLYNRMAQELFKYNPMPQESAKAFLSYINSYDNHVNFLFNSVDNLFLIKTNALIQNSDGWVTGSLSVAGIESILNEYESDKSSIQKYLALAYAAKLISELEQRILMDTSFFKMLSLSAICNPDMFGDEWMLQHFDFIFEFFSRRSLGFPSYPDVFIDYKEKLDYISIIEKMRSHNIPSLNVFEVVKKSDGYVVFICKNVVSEKSKMEVREVVLNKETISDATINYVLLFNIQKFYQISMYLQGNIVNKQTTLFNLEKMSNLQYESYMGFLTNFEVGIMVAARKSKTNNK